MANRPHTNGLERVACGMEQKEKLKRIMNEMVEGCFGFDVCSAQLQS